LAAKEKPEEQAEQWVASEQLMQLVIVEAQAGEQVSLSALRVK